MYIYIYIFTKLHTLEPITLQKLILPTKLDDQCTFNYFVTNNVNMFSNLTRTIARLIYALQEDKFACGFECGKQCLI